jgi:ABC-type branched-subunit amino acid transport system substrate-binding protein
VRAEVRLGDAPVPASVVPCVGCHGPDGLGGATAMCAVAPPSLQWPVLTDPAGHRHDARQHGRFDKAGIARAIRDGIDPDGNALDKGMPRYILHDDDLADLVAYLQAIATESDPGLYSDRIRIGTVLPLDGPLQGAGNTARALLEAIFADVNRNGGIHGRQLELVVGRYGDSDDPAIWAARDLLAEQPVFALLSPLLPGYDAELAALAEDEAIPLIGPYTNLPAVRNADGELNGYTFYMHPGLEQQSEALVQALTARPGAADARLGIVYPRLRDFDSLAGASGRRAELLGLEHTALPPFPFEDFDPAAVVAELQSDDVDTVLFLGNAEQFAALATTAADSQWQPTLLAPASLAERGAAALIGRYDGRVLLSYSTMPADASPEAAARLASLQEATGTGQAYEDLQVSAYAATTVLLEALQQTGRQPSRSGLVDLLTAPGGFETGLTRPIAFSDSSRIGAAGAYVVEVDLAAGKVDPGGWTALSQ